MVVTLIGYRGTGKSTLAGPLSQRLGFEWVDADDELERRAGRTIREIFEGGGESEFRVLERALLHELLGGSNLVIAAGGGAILNAETRRQMRESGPVLWLNADPRVLARRINEDQTTRERRPALTALNGLEEIEAVMKERLPLYRETSHVELYTDERSMEELVVEAETFVRSFGQQ